MQNFMKLKGFKNAYCDALGSSLNEFVDLRKMEEENEIAGFLTEEETKKIVEYAIIKNKIAGVSELYLKVPNVGFVGELGLKYGLCVKEIVSARIIDNLSVKDFVGGNIIVEVESLLEYNDGYLSKIVDFCASTDTPVLVKVGQDLEEVGRVVNKFKMSPSEVLEDYGFLDRKCLIYGLNFFDKEEQKLIKNYQPTLILSPKDDGESGRGAINLYNLVYNEFDFNFASGKCSKIDMLLEGKLALLNTANLMYERGLVPAGVVLQALQSMTGEVSVEIDEFARKEIVFDKIVSIEDESLKNRFLQLRNDIKEIVAGGRFDKI